MEEQDYPIRVHVAIRRSPDEVWPYITEVEHWNEWNAARLSSAEWEEGGKLHWEVGGFSSILEPLNPARMVHFQLVGAFTQDTVFTLEPSGDGRSTEFTVHEKYAGVSLSDGGATKRRRWESDLARLKKLAESEATPASASEEGEPFLGRIHELIAAGEKFEAMKLYAKTTGKGPDLAKKYVDEVASRMSGGHGSSTRAERREVTVVGKTLEEAQAKLQALIPADGLLLKSKIANKGERRITESGSTVDEAFAKAEKKLLGEEEVILRRVISEPVERTVTVKAPDPDRARDLAKQSLAEGEKVVQVTELTAGRRRLLGLVSAVNEYCVVIRVKKAVVEVVCSCPAEIRATISQSEQVGEDSAFETAGTWTPTNPKFASHMPLSDLQRIFIFTDGNGQTVLDSPVATGTLQDTAEAPLKDFMGKVQFDIIARSNVASQIQQTGQFPESAWAAMSKIDSAVTQKARAGTYRSVVRVVADPRTKEQGVFVLIYRM